MKRLLVVMLAVTMMFGGCSESNEKKAQRLIKEQLNVTLHDLNSYESVEFGKLDSVFNNLLEEDSFKKYFSRRLICQKMRNDMFREATAIRYFDEQKSDELRNNAYIDSTWHYKQLEDSIKRNFIPKFKGWSMSHSFRANNASGNKVLVHKMYCFDEFITEILEDEDYETYHSFNLENELREIEKKFLGLE